MQSSGSSGIASEANCVVCLPSISDPQSVEGSRLAAQWPGAWAAVWAGALTAALVELGAGSLLLTKDGRETQTEAEIQRWRRDEDTDLIGGAVGKQEPCSNKAEPIIT